MPPQVGDLNMMMTMPSKLIMPWLGDGRGVRPDFASAYALKASRRAAR